MRKHHTVSRLERPWVLGITFDRPNSCERSMNVGNQQLLAIALVCLVSVACGSLCCEYNISSCAIQAQLEAVSVTLRVLGGVR